ncbi:MAG: fumarate/nitrate reduction transcriptional regulator Fnr [Ectothiorhodospiraceae bacterium]
MAQHRADPAEIRRLREACNTCSLNELCLPMSLKAEDVEALDRIVQRRRPLHKGEALFHAGDASESVYAVRTGALETVNTSQDGEEQVTGFYLPGELLGLDAIASGTHRSTATALETTSVCQIPLGDLESLATHVAGLQHHLLRIMSREISGEQDMVLAMAQRNAEQRLAIFLLGFSDRFANRGLSATRFRLPMSRHELSNYLGLAPETMSRMFRRFSDAGWLTASGKEITLDDPEALRELSRANEATMSRDIGKRGQS